MTPVEYIEEDNCDHKEAYYTTGGRYCPKCGKHFGIYISPYTIQDTGSFKNELDR